MSLSDNIGKIDDYVILRIIVLIIIFVYGSDYGIVIKFKIYACLKRSSPLHLSESDGD